MLAEFILFTFRSFLFFKIIISSSVLKISVEISEEESVRTLPKVINLRLPGV